jgi:hypothetical protein
VRVRSAATQAGKGALGQVFGGEAVIVRGGGAFRVRSCVLLEWKLSESPPLASAGGWSLDAATGRELPFAAAAASMGGGREGRGGPG